MTPRRALAPLLFLLFAAAPAAAAPDHTRSAQADALFEEARKLIAGGRYAEACARFAESERLDHGVGTLLNLADCQERDGHLATAWAGFRATEAAAAAEGQPDRERIAHERALALATRVARLTIVLPPGLEPGLTLSHDGEPIERALWGKALPVDPGDHLIEAGAPGKQPYRVEVHVPHENGVWIVVRVPPLEARSGADGAPPGGLRRKLGLAGGAVGLAGLAVAGGFSVTALVKNGLADPRCPGDACDPEGARLRHDARAATTVGTAALLAGSAVLAVGVTFYLTAPTRPITARAGATGALAGLSLGTAW